MFKLKKCQKIGIINDAYFGKIKNVPISGEAIKQFINNVVYKHPNREVLLKNLSDIYVLVAYYDAQKLLREGENLERNYEKR